MSIHGSGKITQDGLVFYIDANNVKSYAGEPTTNLNKARSDYTGTSYSTDGEWTSDPTRFTKTFYSNVETPIGNGATHCIESGTTGFHHLSRWGGGEESGAHSISCYVYPLSTNINNFTIGMLGDSGNMVTFDFTTNGITYGGSISNRNAFIQPLRDWPGWYRVGANIEGRFGGWVGSIGLNTYTSYTPSSPYKSFYITGIQYEYKDHITQYVTGSRSNTEGLYDLTKNSALDLTNAAYDSSADINFNGSNYITLSKTAAQLGLSSSSPMSVGAWIYVTSLSGYVHIVDGSGNRWHLAIESAGDGGSAYFWNGSSYHSTSSPSITTNKWIHLMGVQETSLLKIYINGTLATNGSLSSAATNLLQDCTVAIGYWQGNNSRYMQGKIRNVSIYNRALSSREVLQNFNSAKGRYNL